MNTQQYTAQAQAHHANAIAFHGCGWFDSSYELASGTQVTEGLSIEEFNLWVLASEQRHAAKAAEKAAGKALALS